MMKVKNVIFSKEVSFQDLSKEIDLIHQLGFFVEVESLDDYIGLANSPYELRAVIWKEVKELKQ